MSGTDIEDRAPRHYRIPAVLAFLTVATVFLLLLYATSAWGNYDEWSADPASPSPARAYLTGDSITYWDAPRIDAVRPGWHIEGVPGRQVQTLATQVEQILAADPNPRLVIVELGTNTAGWEDYEALLRNALAPIPATTRIMLVTPYRDADRFGAGTDWDANLKSFQQYYIARAMNRLAEQYGICVARWRYMAHRHPELLKDGIHPNMAGRAALTDLLIQTAKDCS